MRVAIVGCGNIAANHVIAFRGAGVEIVGCADVDAVRAGREPAVTGRDAARSLAILTALYASATSGHPERVPTLETTR